MGWDRSLYSCIAFISVFIFASSAPFDDFSDLRGPYCENRGRCCNGRQDTCAIPILGTLCYCDDFCNNTRVDDCCPDYWSFCRGIYVPIPTRIPTTSRAPEIEEMKSCTYNGVNYFQKARIKVNCNECLCGGELNSNWTCETNKCLIDGNIIKTINEESPYGWTATNYSEFYGRTLADGIGLRLGTLPPQRFVLRMNPVRRIYDPNALPRFFDSEEKWPGLVSDIQDQGWCASSWAISTAAVASDRYAIVSKGYEKVQLSAQNLLSCNTKGQQNCEGGHLDRAWSFVRYNGLVDEDCFPYAAKFEKCLVKRKGRLLDAGCQPPPYKERKNRYTVTPAYRLGNETDIMYEITRSGPVQATMKVYHDFFMYRGGIYRHTDLSMNELQGYHSVRIIGWGEEYTFNGVQKYWKVANSWGPNWGENGYFRIVRGVDECEIESFVLAVWPHVDRKIFLTNANEII
ncbi:hypothetical protein NQ315_009289 [Exocentrus adspersus]|uniref:SMB domain-containing protein n=1 Tax=Exocentrus adspersus TaxID=1586481 RepID=A0AAV8WH45_9CUCU|nr:hypothetical protein NQ315_009289 [Exocentrus adspersus]